MPSAFFLPNRKGVEVPGTIMKHIAPQLDPGAVILFGQEATTENAVRVIKEHDPPYVFTTGHGIPCATTLLDNQPFVSLALPQMNRQVCDRDRNLDLFRGRVVHLHSCWCGKLLAPKLVQEHGAWAVFAHDDEFLFLLPEDGKTIDKVIAAPFLAEFTVDQIMLSGGTAGEAQEARMRAYDKWIEYFTEGEGAEMKGAPLIVRILRVDRMISKLYGDRTATVAKKGQVKPFTLSLPLEVEGGAGVPLMALALPLAFVVMGHGTEGHHGLG